MKHSILLVVLCCSAPSGSIPANYHALTLQQSGPGERIAAQPVKPYDATLYIGTKEIRVGPTWFHIDSMFVWDSVRMNYYTRQEDRLNVETIITVAPAKDKPGVWQFILIWPGDSLKAIEATAKLTDNDNH